MNNPAYDSGYLNSAKLSGRYLFKLIARNCSDCFGIIYKYMKSDYRRYMDMGNPLYLCKTPKQIMGNMGITVDLNAEISNTYDEFILEWMSDCYITLLRRSEQADGRNTTPRVLGMFCRWLSLFYLVTT